MKRQATQGAGSKARRRAGSVFAGAATAGLGAAGGLFGGLGGGEMYTKEEAQRRALQMMVETVDDFSAPLQAETYVDQRVRPVCEMLERLAPRKALQLQVLEMVGILAQAPCSPATGTFLP